MKKRLKKLTDIALDAPHTVIVAGDEASLYLQATLQVVWHARGQPPLCKLHPGRESTHFYAALNLMTGEETTLRTQLMNAEASVLLLMRLLAAYPQRPILLFWDRAPWHRGNPIRHLLEAHPRLEILYLPTAAPDLNPQEQVWKATRTAVSHNHYQRNLQLLADDFEQHLLSTRFPCSLLHKHNYPQLCAMSI